MRQYRRGIVISLWYVNLLWVNAAYSQRSSSFGVCLERPLNIAPRALAVLISSGSRADIAIVASDQPTLSLFHLDTNDAVVPAGEFSFERRQQCVSSSDLDADGLGEIITLSSDGAQVTVISHDSTRSWPVPFGDGSRPQLIAFGDVNNDGSQDILLFGRSMAGVTTLLGKKNGTFSPGPLLFPDVSVSDVHVADLNADGIADVVLLNWLSNQMVVMYGISRMVFSEQVTVELPGEPSQMALTATATDRTVRVAVTLPEDRRILILAGDAAGNFGVTDNIVCPGQPAGVMMADLNNDGLADIVTSTPRGFYVAYGSATSDFSEACLFGCGQPGSPWSVADVDGDGFPDLMVADRSLRRLVIVRNSLCTNHPAQRVDYAVGSWPRGIVISDLNGDTFPDIAVVNTHSSSASLLVNNGDGTMRGQVSITLPDRPDYVSSVGGTLLVSHADTDRLTVVSPFAAGGIGMPISMPTGDRPQVVLAKSDPQRESLEIVVRSRRSQDGALTLSRFEEISPRQYVERSLFASVREKIKALAIDYGVTGAAYQLFFCTNDRLSRKSTLWRADGSHAFVFSNVRQLFAYSDSLGSTRSLSSGFFNEDSLRDYAIFEGSPINALGIGFGRPQGRADSLIWIHGFQPADIDGTRILDVNGDGFPDIVGIDAQRNALVVWYGNGGGGFDEANALPGTEGATGFAFGCLRNNAVQDLVVAHGPRGSVSVIFGPLAP